MPDPESLKSTAGLVVYSAGTIAFLLFLVWMLYRIFAHAHAATSYGPPCEPCDRPSDAQLAAFYGVYPGGRNDPYPPSPPPPLEG